METALSRFRAVLAFLVGIVLPLCVFALTHRRQLRIAGVFAASEIRANAMLLLVAAGVVGGTLLLGAGATSLHATLRSIRARTSTRMLLVGSSLLILPIGLLLADLRVRYKRFSEVQYQQIAAEYVRKNDFLNARLNCDLYLELYPYRRPEGKIPDPVCVPVRRFTSGMARVAEFIRNQELRVTTADGVTAPVGWPARRQALELLTHWAGGADGKSVP